MIKKNELLLKKLKELATLDIVKSNFKLKLNSGSFIPNGIFKKLYNNYVIKNEKSKENNNFTIIVYCNEIKYEYFIHTMVLDSEYFWVLLEGNFPIKNEITINVNDLEVINILIKYLYLSEFDYNNINKENIDELLKISDQFGFENLKKICDLVIKFMFEYI